VTVPRRTLRRATAGDAPFIAAMLAEAASWERAPGERPCPLDDLLTIPEIADYVEDWGRAGDGGVIAGVGGVPAGACWFRRFTPEHPGYGFIGADVPGLGLGVDPAFQGRGLGAALLAATVDMARGRGVGALGLSVSERNQVARRLYERAGFVVVGREGDGLTMRLDLDGKEAEEQDSNPLLKG
jgi:ribosomal protein S18 acetylase RimI-like enzyme